MFNLICHNCSRRACKPRQHRRVISSPGPNVKNLLSLLHIERRKINCVEYRLAVVDSAFGRKGHDHVLIQECRVVGRSLDVVAPDKYFPRTSTDKVLPWYCRKRSFKPFVLRSPRGRSDQVCIKVPMCFQSLHVPPHKPFADFSASSLHTKDSKAVNK